MRVLLAVDESPGASRVAERAVELFGAAAEAEFLIVSVSEPMVALPEPPFPGCPAPSNLSRWRSGLAANDAEARAAVQHASAVLPTATLMVLSGDPAERICALAEERDADVVVVGRRDAGPIRRLLMPSVAAGILRGCRRPVLVVPEDGPSRRRSAARVTSG